MSSVSESRGNDELERYAVNIDILLDHITSCPLDIGHTACPREQKIVEEAGFANISRPMMAVEILSRRILPGVDSFIHGRSYSNLKCFSRMILPLLSSTSSYFRIVDIDP